MCPRIESAVKKGGEVERTDRGQREEAREKRRSGSETRRHALNRPRRLKSRQGARIKIRRLSSARMKATYRTCRRILSSQVVGSGAATFSTR